MPSRKRKLQIEVDEDVGRRLDELAAVSERYGDSSDVASEVVRLYVGMLEVLEDHMGRFKRRQRFREKGKVKAARKAGSSAPKR